MFCIQIIIISRKKLASEKAEEEEQKKKNAKNLSFLSGMEEERKLFLDILKPQNT